MCYKMVRIKKSLFFFYIVLLYDLICLESSSHMSTHCKLKYKITVTQKC